MISFLRGSALAVSVLVFLTLLGSSAGLYPLTRGQGWTMASAAMLSFFAVVLTGPTRRK